MFLKFLNLLDVVLTCPILKACPSFGSLIPKSWSRETRFQFQFEQRAHGR